METRQINESLHTVESILMMKKIFGNDRYKNRSECSNDIGGDDDDDDDNNNHHHHHHHHVPNTGHSNINNLHVHIHVDGFCRAHRGGGETKDPSKLRPSVCRLSSVVTLPTLHLFVTKLGW